MEISDDGSVVVLNTTEIHLLLNFEVKLTVNLEIVEQSVFVINELLVVEYLKSQVEFVQKIVVVVELFAYLYEIQDFVRKEMFQDLLRLKKRIYISNHYRGYMDKSFERTKNKFTQNLNEKVNKSLSRSFKKIDDADLLTRNINFNIITYLFFYTTNFTTSIICHKSIKFIMNLII